ncbi:MAG: alpha-glucosidase [Pseudomonadota bacterium]
MSKNEHDWWKKGVFYQIYPRSYMDRNGTGCGDLSGITDRLEYVAKLGVDGVWISPFFSSPMADFGYDVSDYRTVDPMFGSNDDFDILLKRAHDLNLKIIIDMVLSHTSIEHAWFKESRIGKDNRKADWYVWADAKEDGTPPNNWQSVFGGSAWTFDTRRGQYYLHNFLKEQPDLNFHNPAVPKQMLSECEYWLERGVDGFRLDVINFCFHDKELRDNPPRDKNAFTTGVQVESPYPYTMQSHIYDKSQPENLGFLKSLRELMDRYPGTMTLGEIGDDDPYKLAVEYTSGKDYLHTTYNTHLISGTDARNITPETIEVPFKEFMSQAGDGWPSWAFSNHDVVRSATRWGKDVQNKEAFAVLLNKLLLSLRGTPFLYQGEELGLPEASIPFEKLQDPWGIFLWPEWQGRDGCRTPMPWYEDKKNAGFSTADETWLPIPHDHVVRAVDKQLEDPDSVLHQTQKFIHWRKEQPALQLGEIEFLDTDNDSLIVFERHHDNQKMRCIFNLSEEKIIYDNVEVGALGTHYQEL